MNYCFGMSPLKIGADVAQNDRIASLLDFRYNVLHMKPVSYTHLTLPTNREV